jgi:hypothetical protein
MASEINKEIQLEITYVLFIDGAHRTGASWDS